MAALAFRENRVTAPLIVVQIATGILVDWTRVGRQVVFLPVFLAMSWAMRRLMPKLSPSDRWNAALVWFIVCASTCRGSSGRTLSRLAEGRSQADRMAGANQGAHHDHLCQRSTRQVGDHGINIYRTAADGSWQLAVGSWQYDADRDPCCTEAEALNSEL